jgi:hypothetical protein
MLSLIKTLGIEMSARKGAGPFLLTFCIASFFFKFKSFALECLAFLTVWDLLSLVQSLIIPNGPRPKEQVLRSPAGPFA